MASHAKRRRILLSASAGAALGFFALHPYTMLVYGLYMRHKPGSGMPQAADMMHGVFHLDAMPMGLPFAALGAAAGLFFGFWLEAVRQREEMEKRACAVDTLRQLMVTLSHYLLNASTVIGGYASHVMKKEDNEEIRKHLAVIKDEAVCIEDVVKSLQSLETVAAEHYTGSGESMMIDIQKQLEQRIKDSAGKRAISKGNAQAQGGTP
ncbi:MAG: hypothetical protein HZC51_12345 [Nitrospirae bacterium]|nr:hypothetical protein [Nitrospirota bacterium]